MTELRSVTCHMESHSVTCHPTQVSASRLNPSHAGRYSIYLPGGMEGCVDLVTRKRSRRESNPRPLGPESNALTTEPPSNIVKLDVAVKRRSYDFGVTSGVSHSAESNFQHRDPDEIFREFFGGKDPFEAFFGNNDPFDAFFTDPGNTVFSYEHENN